MVTLRAEIHCTSLVIARGAHVNGTVAAERVVVDGNVEGPIQGGDVFLKSQAKVVGDIICSSRLVSRDTVRAKETVQWDSLWAGGSLGLLVAMAAGCL
jgi:cytoskeletal protein CcmA (bactofilin family)